ncbi:MAG: phosphoadenylyl-sulfate reductase [Actinomycetia bacterium]|nr:phosphoadenylyl-sulfate reductase [Actinomycetes bacterium]
MTETTVRPARPAPNRALVEDAALRYAGADADEVLAWVAETFEPGRVAVASSMADTALPHLVARHLPGVDVIFLDTGYHFPQTLATRDELAAGVDVTIRTVRAELTVAEQDEQHGPDLFARDPAACCAMRKVQPLTRALADYDAWITGVRRAESPTRAGTPVIEWDRTFDLVKVNPLVGWDDDAVAAYLSTHDVPVNPLLSQGYPSIGCAPCTRRVESGEDPRSGRWSGFAKTECGLHPGGDGIPVQAPKDMS